MQHRSDPNADRQAGIADVGATLHGVLIPLAKKRSGSYCGGSGLIPLHKVLG
jgi:hypothetical protein